MNWENILCILILFILTGFIFYQIKLWCLEKDKLKHEETMLKTRQNHEKEMFDKKLLERCVDKTKDPDKCKELLFKQK